MILSTHIVEDVTDLCQRMAIIAQGQVLLSGEPAEAIRSLDGRVWRRSVANTVIEDYKNRFTVLSTRLAGGKTIVHVLADAKPDDGFENVSPDLEDVYFGQSVRLPKPESGLTGEFHVRRNFSFRAETAAQKSAVLDDRAWRLVRSRSRRPGQIPVQVGGGVGNVHRNAPYVITQWLIIVHAARDVSYHRLRRGRRVAGSFDNGTAELFFATPISRTAYLGGRFTAGYLAAAVVS